MKRNVLRLWSRQFSLWDHKITQGYRVDNQQHNRETVWSTSHRTVILSDILFTLKAKTITGDNNLDAAFLGKSAEELNSVIWSNTSVLVFYKNPIRRHTINTQLFSSLKWLENEAKGSALWHVSWVKFKNRDCFTSSILD